MKQEKKKTMMCPILHTEQWDCGRIHSDGKLSVRAVESCRFAQVPETDLYLLYMIREWEGVSALWFHPQQQQTLKNQQEKCHTGKKVKLSGNTGQP